MAVVTERRGWSRCKTHALTCARCNGVIQVGDCYQWSNLDRKARHLLAGDVCDPQWQPESANGNPWEPREREPEPSEPEPAKVPRTAPAVPGSIDALIDARIDARLAGFEPESAIDADAVRDIVASAVETLRESLTARVRIERADRPEVLVENAHPALADLLALVAHRKHVYLYGPAGGGKDHACKVVADALGLRFGLISLTPTAPASRIEGFINAKGEFSDTEFYQCYAHGGLFCISEGDNMSGALQVAFNTALANGHAPFPCGTVQRHPDFVVVMSGNTINGADGHYGERRRFDGAFLSRFARMAWNYDTAHERAIALGRNPAALPWVTWVQHVREYARKNAPTMLVTPRASYDGADLFGSLPTAKLADWYVLAGLDADTRAKVLTACPLPEAA